MRMLPVALRASSTASGLTPKLKTKFAVMLSGGSPASVSLIWLAITVTVQITPGGRSAVGFNVIWFVPEPLTANGWRFPGAGHSIVNELVVAFTFSLKLTTILAPLRMSIAPFVGFVVVTAGGLSIVKLKTKFAAMFCGGSFASWSSTWAAKTVTVTNSPFVKSVFGLIVNVVGPPVTTVSATFRVPLVAPTIWNQLPVTLTGSLNVMLTFVLFACWVAPFVGVVAVTVGATSIVKLNTKFAAMLSGGSTLSWSVTCAATIVTVHVSPAAKSTFGLMVKVVGPPVTTVAATLRAPLVGQAIENHSPVTLTGSLNVTVMFVFVAWSTAPLVGVVAVTVGATSTVVKLKTKLAAMLSGGSPLSWSATCAAKTVTVQTSPLPKSAFGLIVKVVGPPVTTVSATFRVPLIGHTIWNQLPVTFTASLKVTVTLELMATPVAPLVGVVAVTDGAWSIVKLKTKFAVMFWGGSFVSWSLTCAAKTVTVTNSPFVKSAGLMSNVVGPPVTTVSATFFVPLVAPTIWNQLPVTSTGSLNVMLMFVLFATCVAPFVGVVAVTEGAASIVKLNTKLAAMLSGGSLVSTSVTCAAKIVTVQLSPGEKSVFGLMVKDVDGEGGVTAVSAGFLVPLVVQTIWNQLPVTLTDSLNVTVMSVLVGRSTAPFVGVVAVTVGASSCSVVVKLKTKLAAIWSGGSITSWSLTCAAKTVTVQVSVGEKSLVGLIVKVVGPPVTVVSATSRVPLSSHTIWNQLPVTLTASLNVMVMSVFCATSVAPFVGVLAVTLGGASTLSVSRAVSFGVNPLVTV